MNTLVETSFLSDPNDIKKHNSSAGDEVKAIIENSPTSDSERREGYQDAVDIYVARHSRVGRRVTAIDILSEVVRLRTVEHDFMESSQSVSMPKNDGGGVTTREVKGIVARIRQAKKRLRSPS